MRRDAPPTFEPRRLGRRDLEAPLGPGMRRLPAHAREALHARRRDLIRRTDPWNPVRLRRIRRAACLGAVLVPILANVFWRFDASSLPGLGGLGLLYGTVVGFWSPGPALSGALLGLVGILALLLDGQAPFSSGLGFVWFYHLAFVAIGAAIGVGEALREP